MLKIAICTNDEIMRDKINAIIKEYFWKRERYCLIKCFSSGVDLLNSRIYYDIIILEQDLPILNGIETGKKIRSR